jgi:hypothetical protein
MVLDRLGKFALLIGVRTPILCLFSVLLFGTAFLLLANYTYTPVYKNAEGTLDGECVVVRADYELYEKLAMEEYAFCIASNGEKYQYQIRGMEEAGGTCTIRLFPVQQSRVISGGATQVEFVVGKERAIDRLLSGGMS